MRVLVACEYSGVVRDAFIRAGHDAMSCDLLDTEAPGPHYKGDVRDVLGDGWDLMIAHPPCTHLAVSGAAWFEEKRKDGRQQESIEFFISLANALIERIAIENPVGIMSSVWRKPDQVIQPYYFGDSMSKKTCLWLKNLPKLYHNPAPNLFDGVVTHVDRGEMIVFSSGTTMPKWYADAWRLPKEERWKVRSTTFRGIAEAMAAQWGGL